MMASVSFAGGKVFYGTANSYFKVQTYNTGNSWLNKGYFKNMNRRGNGLEGFFMAAGTSDSQGFKEVTGITINSSVNNNCGSCMTIGGLVGTVSGGIASSHLNAYNTYFHSVNLTNRYGRGYKASQFGYTKSSTRIIGLGGSGGISGGRAY